MESGKPRARKAWWWNTAPGILCSLEISCQSERSEMANAGRTASREVRSQPAEGPSCTADPLQAMEQMLVNLQN